MELNEFFDRGLFGYNYRYVITHFWIIPVEISRHLKWFVQRGYRGYSDRDNWSIDYYLNSWLPAALRNLKNSHGYPVDMLPIQYQMSGEDIPKEICEAAHANWRNILENIAKGFEANKKLSELDYNYDDKNEEAQLRDRSELGFYLFKTYFNNLWD